MFDNIGGKIKTLAQVICWLGIIASVITGFSMWRYSFGSGLLMMILGGLSSWVGSFLIYGLGQLIENSDTLVALSIQAKNELKKQAVTTEVQSGTTPAKTKHQWRCSHCGKMVSGPVCTNCGNVEREVLSNTTEQTDRCPHCNGKIVFPEGTNSAVCPWCDKTIYIQR